MTITVLFFGVVALVIGAALGWVAGSARKSAEVQRALAEGQTTPEEAEAIFRLTSLPTFEERFVIPPLAREEAIESALDPLTHKQQVGFGFNQAPTRRW